MSLQKNYRAGALGHTKHLERQNSLYGDNTTKMTKVGL